MIVAAVFRALIKLGQNVSETNRRRTNPLRAAVLGIMSVALGLICANWEQPSLASELAWQALQEGGAVALLRHAHAPGTGDPPEFRLGDCSTQRNLWSCPREWCRSADPRTGPRVIRRPQRTA